MAAAKGKMQAIVSESNIPAPSAAPSPPATPEQVEQAARKLNAILAPAREPATSLKLYQIPDAFEQLAQRIADTGLDGEIPPDLEAEIDALEKTLEGKTDAVCALIRRFTLQSDAAKVEADRLSQLARIRANAADRLKLYLHDTLVRMGRDRVETDRFKARVQKNGRPSIRWPGDIATLPAVYQHVTVTLNGTKAYEDWKDGVTLPIGFIVEVGSHLRIS